MLALTRQEAKRASVLTQAIRLRLAEGPFFAARCMLGEIGLPGSG